MFNQPMTRLERKRLFENRVWKKGDIFNDYCYDKVILGNKVPITEEEIVEYVIDGLSSMTLRNQVRMHSFFTVTEFPKIFRRISLETPDTSIVRRNYSGKENLKTVSPKMVSKDSPKPKLKE